MQGTECVQAARYVHGQVHVFHVGQMRQLDGFIRGLQQPQMLDFFVREFDLLVAVRILRDLLQI